MGLMEELNRICDEQVFQTHLYVKDLATGGVFARNDQSVVSSGSTRKLYIMMAALREVARGRFALDTPFTLDAEYQRRSSHGKVPGETLFNYTAGIFQNFRPGTEITFQDAITMMIVVSDNTCTGKLVDMIGVDSINELCQSIGMRGTTLRYSLTPDRTPRPVEQTNATSARDMGLMLEHIVKGTSDATAAARLGVTPELCQLAIRILSWQKLKTLLSPMLPPGANVAHKSGTPVGGGGSNDVGIVFAGTEPRFIISYYSAGVPALTPEGMPGKTLADRHAAHLCRVCWDHLVQ